MANPIFNGGSAPTNNISNILQMVTMLSRQPNPVVALTAMNPQLAQQLQGKSPQEIEQYVRAEYAKRGINLDAILAQLNIF